MPDNQIIVDIEAIGFEGIAIARKDNLVYFVKGAVPGDRASIMITRKRRRYAEAIIRELIEASPLRIDAPCAHFGQCGGCSWQNLGYDEQLKWKRTHVIDSFERIGKIKTGELTETIPSDREYHYRNKMEFSFGASRWLTIDEVNSEDEVLNKNFALGLHIPGRYDKILDIGDCLLQEDMCNNILRLVKAKALELGCPAYDQRKHIGFLKNLIIRSSRKPEIMVILLTQTPESDNEVQFIDWFMRDLVNEADGITSIIHAVNDTVNPVAVGGISAIRGTEFLTETIHNVSFRISPFSFFQSNPYQLDKFVNLIEEAALPLDGKIVWDLYCGAGTISLPISKNAPKVYGFELSESSISDAKVNAELNNINNCEFIAIDLHKKNIAEVLMNYEKPDVIIIDPPRSGIHQNLIDTILDIRPKKIVYVSCNPATQARDCQLLAEAYDIIRLVPFDVFPQTYHVEAIATLVLKDEL